jgi:uncharacterized damage-inducible protein DinB
MTVKDLEVLFDYGYWANRKLFATIARLTPEQYTRTVDGTHGCVRKTMVHILSAEWGWLGRCDGQDRGARLDPADYPTPESLVDAWDKIEKRLRGFLSRLRDEDLARMVEFTLGGSDKYSMPLGELMRHAANHGVHHRGQVSLLLRLLGQAPADFDLLFYCAQTRGLSAP